MKIRSIDGETLFECDARNIKNALQAAVSQAANLTGAYLRSADLRSADLTGADLEGADLTGADLRGAYLRSADLRSADLRSADLTGADLRSAYLRSAYLRSAYLRSADLEGADLRGADLEGADLRSAELEGAKLPNFQICPEDGAFIAYKKVDSGVITLEIPADAKRTSSLVGRKCRAEFVRVIEGSGASGRGGKYVEGEICRPDAYDDDIRIECTSGVHFFMTRQEAEEWN